MSYQFKNSKISNFQEMIGQALLDGSFQQLEGEKQMELFLKGYEGQPQKLVNLAQNLGPGFQKGLIKFNPQELVDKATELIPQKKIQRNNQQQRKPDLPGERKQPLSAEKELNLTIGKEIYIGFKAMSVATLKL